MKNKILIICGPTATGKTALGIRLAKKFSGEIISADSRQIYRDLSSLTGVGDSNGVKTWLQEIVDPSENFNIAQWRRMFWAVVENMHKENKLPIVVGVTGFYLKSIIENIETIDIPRDEKLRKVLEDKTVRELVEILKTKNISRYEEMNESDGRNPRRLVRAIEVALYKENREQKSKLNPTADFFIVGLIATMGILEKRIDKNIEKRLDGAIEETKELMSRKLTSNLSSLQTHAYRNLSAYLNGEISKVEAIQNWKRGEHQDARKQYAKLQSMGQVKWFDISDLGFESELEGVVKNWYNGG